MKETIKYSEGCSEKCSLPLLLHVFICSGNRLIHSDVEEKGKRKQML